MSFECLLEDIVVAAAHEIKISYCVRHRLMSSMGGSQRDEEL